MSNAPKPFKDVVVGNTIYVTTPSTIHIVVVTKIRTTSDTNIRLHTRDFSLNVNPDNHNNEVRGIRGVMVFTSEDDAYQHFTTTK